jgi:hypothetical protein
MLESPPEGDRAFRSLTIQVPRFGTTRPTKPVAGSKSLVAGKPGNGHCTAAGVPGTAAGVADQWPPATIPANSGSTAASRWPRLPNGGYFSRYQVPQKSKKLHVAKGQHYQCGKVIEAVKRFLPSPRLITKVAKAWVIFVVKRTERYPVQLPTSPNSICHRPGARDHRAHLLPPLRGLVILTALPRIPAHGAKKRAPCTSIWALSLRASGTCVLVTARTRNFPSIQQETRIVSTSHPRRVDGQGGQLRIVSAEGCTPWLPWPCWPSLVRHGHPASPCVFTL